MQHLNYCRQLLDAFSQDHKISFPASIQEGQDEYVRELAKSVYPVIKGASKFLLPFNGRILDDREMRAIGDKIELPYKEIAIEYEAPDVPDIPGQMAYPKRIVFAKDLGDSIGIGSACYTKTLGSWCLFLPVAIPKEGAVVSRSPLKFAMQIHPLVNNPYDYADDIFAVLDLINALACKNVHIEKSPAKATKQGKKVKAALPFDDYHFLTVDVPGKAGVRGEGLGGSHRSPREHLRRGHIRRLESGPIWVNACVVNAGIGSKVGKSYLVRRTPQ